MGRRKSPIPRAKNKKGYLCCYHDGKDHYFGQYGTPEAESAYRRFVAQLSNPSGQIVQSSALSDVAVLFIKSADRPKTFAKIQQLHTIVEHACERFSGRSLESISPQEWKEWIKDNASKRDETGTPRYSETTLRLWFSKIKRLYQFAVETKLITGNDAAPVLAIRKLPTESARRERNVHPVPRHDVELTIEQLTPTVADMVRLQLLTGMRPSDLFEMTAEQITTGGRLTVSGISRDLDQTKLWAYVRKQHKTSHHGHERIILLNQDCQTILQPRINERRKSVPLFQPAESVAESYGRKSLDYARGRIGARPYRQKWTRQSYAQAIERAAKKAGVPHWSPYQIRHLVAAEVQEKHGLDAARALLGQKSFSVAAHYADLDFKKAANVASSR